MTSDDTKVDTSGHLGPKRKRRLGPQTPTENWKAATREHLTAIVCSVSGRNIARFNLAPDRDFVLLAIQSLPKMTDLADKYKWQVIDTCKRAEKAEAERDALSARVVETEAERNRLARNRLAKLNAGLVHDYNTLNCLGARQDEKVLALSARVRELTDALTKLLIVVDDVASRIGWCDRGERERARRALIGKDPS